MDKDLKQALFKTIRDFYKRSSQYSTALKASKSSFSGIRNGSRYICSICKNDRFKPSEVEIDHFPIPVCDYKRYWYEYTVDEYIDRVFNLCVRVLCKPCHKTWTKEQRVLRKAGKIRNCD